MEGSPYIDPVLDRLKELIETNTGVYKAFYFGDPLAIPASSLPAVMLRKIGTSTGVFSNAEDADEMRIAITIVTDVRQDIGQGANLAAGTTRLYALMEGRNADYGRKDSCLLSILRRNVNLGDGLRLDVGEVTRITYEDAREAGNIYRTEATAEFLVSWVQLR